VVILVHYKIVAAFLLRDVMQDSSEHKLLGLKDTYTLIFSFTVIS